MNTGRAVTVDGGLGSQPFCATALSNTVTLVVAGATAGSMTRPREIYSAVITNPGAALAYVQVFNANAPTAVTLGTTPPTQSYGIPAGQTIVLIYGDIGQQYPKGICVAATTTPSGASAPASALVVNMGYA